MAVIKISNGNHQARLADASGRVMSRVFATKKEADQQDWEWKLQKREGALVSASSQRITVAEFFEAWFKDHQHESSKSGWRRTQFHYFRDYILPVLGPVKLRAVTPAMIGRVFSKMTEEGYSPKTQLNVFGTLRKFFGDAVENYQLMTFNPAIRKLRPKEIVGEAPHLNLDQAKELLTYVVGKPFDVAIWLEIYLGLRFGEVLGLQWGDIDLDSGRLVVRRVYVRATKTIREYPKGRRQHPYIIPDELLALLNKEDRRSLFLFPDHEGTYQRYFRVLTRYCKELGLPRLGTHGLRHSSANLYLSHGANKEDLKEFFMHSSMKMTERYLHGWESKIGKVARVINLFGDLPKIDQIGLSEGGKSLN